MSNVETLDTLNALADQGYKYGFFSDIEADTAPPGLDEATVHFISDKKGDPDW